MTDKKIAVVVLNWNGVALLAQFLPKIISFSEEATIYVVDNASTDQSIQYIRDNFPNVKIIENNKNYGFAKGYNIALKSVEEPYYALVNSDIEVTKNWLIPIKNQFENEPNTAIIQPKILDFKNKNLFEYAGAGGGFIDKYGYPFCRGRIFESIEKDTNQYDDTCEIFWASGACFFVRKDFFRILKGFDEDFFAHQEEIDLCWRAFNLCYVIKYNATSVVYHIGGATLNEGNPVKTFLNFRNSLLMLVKNLPKDQLIPILFIRMILDGIAGFKFLFKGKFKHFTAILKAHFYFYKLISINLRKRGFVQKANYYETKSIVYNYFVKRKKIFNS